MVQWKVALAALALQIATGTGCGEAQHVDPAASEKVYQLGAQLFQQGQIRPALEELLRAVKLNPENSDAHYLLAIIALRQANDAEEMTAVESCLQGQDLSLMKQEVEQHFKEADERFQKALLQRPDFSDAQNGLSVVALHFQQWDRAVEWSLKALSNPMYQSPWMAQGNLGWAYLNKKEYPRAAKELREALKANPEFCVGRYRLAKVYYETRNLDGAAEELEKVAAETKCGIQEAHHLLGLVSLRRGDRSRAEAAFKTCVALRPNSCLAKECRIATP